MPSKGCCTKVCQAFIELFIKTLGAGGEYPPGVNSICGKADSDEFCGIF